MRRLGQSTGRVGPGRRLATAGRAGPRRRLATEAGLVDGDGAPRTPVWYRAPGPAPRFKCTACGQCCSRSWSDGGGVTANAEDLETLARGLGSTVDDLHEDGLVAADGDGGGELSFVEQSDGSRRCTFLRGKLCSVHESRPTQCRTYPWWPHKLESREAWLDEGKRCEGVEHADADAVDADFITREALVQTVSRTNGYGYARASSLLDDVDPNLFSEFEADIAGVAYGDADDDENR
ncbi:hypothetical protein M885DRAFT_538264, partial [Pelagophyceae sp. CCMP2097]